MRSSVPWKSLCAGALWLLCAAAESVEPTDPCAGFTWNVTHERALFGGAAQSLIAGHDPSAGPVLAPDHLYELTLTRQDAVSFVVAPGKKSLTDGAYAGLARVHITNPGSYRIALDRPFWIDVVRDHQPLESTDFTGQHGCNAPHKLVAFNLPAGDLVLQLSGVTNDHVRVAVTRAP